MINWKLKTRSLRPIGLDIRHDSVKMIQLAVNGEHISVIAAEKVRIDPRINGCGEERRQFVVSAIKQMLAEGKFQGRKVVSCLPSDKLKITSLRLAKTAEVQIEEELRKQVVQRFGLDPDKDVINYLIAGNVKQGDEIKHELILFAADNETVRSHIKILEDARLRPVGIDTIPCALFRNFERSMRREEDKDYTVVFVDVGSWFTTVVFGRGQEISFVKQIQIGGENFNQEVAAKLGVSIKEAEMLRGTLQMESSRISGVENSAKAEANAKKHPSSAGQDPADNKQGLDVSRREAIVEAVSSVAEKLARKISLCFRYYTVTFRGKRVERAVFAGREADENILLNVLRRQLPVEIEVDQPLKDFDMMNINFDSNRRGSLCEWTVAVGLGLKDCDESKWN